MQKIIVTYPQGEYPIYIQETLSAHQILHHIVGSKVLIVTNDKIAPLFLSSLQEQLSSKKCDSIILPDGECYKTLEQFSTILDELIRKEHHRDTTLIALGGGVIGDITGFAAACYQRGVAFIQIPTTLLAQVDASIGGKTAVNHPFGKNLIGAFHQPKAVFINIDFLASLPDRQYCAGLAEIIKAALIRDKDFFIYLEQHIEALRERRPSVLLHAIEKACGIKRDIVALDERENSIRALLNLGHTFGHAIEQNQNYSGWLHGEAVAVGIVLAAKLSVQRQGLPEDDFKRIINLLKQAHLPTSLPPNANIDDLIKAMRTDKKIKNEKLQFILLQTLGEGVIVSDISEAQIRELLINF